MPSLAPVALPSAALALAVVGLFLYRKRYRACGGVSALQDLTDFVTEEVVCDGVGPPTLVGRFVWQPEGQRALVKMQTDALQSAEALAGALVLTLKAYSGAEYAYYTAVPSLWGLMTNTTPRRCRQPPPPPHRGNDGHAESWLQSCGLRCKRAQPGAYDVRDVRNCARKLCLTGKPRNCRPRPMMRTMYQNLVSRTTM